MKKRLLAVLIVVAISSNCYAQQNFLDTIWSGGIMRTFKVYIPAIYDSQTPRPLVFLFHGLGENASIMENLSKFRSVADTANFILVSPNGTVGTVFPAGFGQSWNNFDFDAVDDVLFVSNLIDTLVGTYNIDTSRIYSAGYSNGGFMGYDLACRLSHRIAAIASVSGSIDITRFPTCDPGREVPVMEIHGTNDSTVPYDGGSFAGIDFLSVDTIINYWIDNNQCNNSPVITELPDIDPSDGSSITEYMYMDCANETEVLLLKVLDGTHTWPGSSEFGSNQDIIADQEIWRFFLRHKLPASITSTSAIIPDLEYSIYPNPASSFLNVSWGESQKMYAPDELLISDLYGRIVLVQQLEGNGPINQVTINLHKLPSGFFVLFSKHDGQLSALEKFIVTK